MPEELQEPMMRTVPGLENVRMVKPAYGVEYDHIDPRELQRESQFCPECSGSSYDFQHHSRPKESR